jgi:tetratricopeptide (TPR) repeat protein
MANYIGVYATKERPHAIGEFPRPLGMRKRLWFVWETPEGYYKVQALNAALQPMAGARNITSKEFLDRFSHEADCSVTPAGRSQPGSQRMDAASVPLPDLFLGEKSGASLPLPASADPGAVLADNPDLLLNWARAERRPKANAPDLAKMPLDRLVGEFVSMDGEEAALVAAKASESTPEDAGENEEGEARQVRQLRSQFVQALLLLRRGAQAESLVLLETMLCGSYGYFKGGAQLFSEFGLGLRRLGFASLALAAHKRALEFAPMDERVLFNIARSYHDLGLLAEARDFLEQALVLSPEFAPARQFLVFLTPSGDDTEQ